MSHLRRLCVYCGSSGAVEARYREAAGGRVTGIIPRRLVDAETAHRGVTELFVVDSMHDRKRLMAEKADAFAVLPGGIGTLDELFDCLLYTSPSPRDGLLSRMPSSA